MSHPELPAEFLRVVQSFYGCTGGNVNSPVWLCGLEWGGGLSTDVPTFISSWAPCPFEDLQYWSWQEFRDNFWAPKSKFCQNVLKVLLVIQKGQNYSDQDYSQHWRVYAHQRTVGLNGLALILNAFPISFAHRSVAAESWKAYKVLFSDGSQKSFPDWTGLKTFWEYKDTVLQYRSETYIATRRKYCPKLIVCFGKDSADDFRRLWGVSVDKKSGSDFTISKDNNDSNDCFGYVLDNGLGKQETLLFIIPFLSGPYGLTTSEQIKKVFTDLLKHMRSIPEFGSDWLGEYSLDKAPQQTGTAEIDNDASDLTKLFPNSDLRSTYYACDALLRSLDSQQSLAVERRTALELMEQQLPKIFHGDVLTESINSLLQQKEQLLKQITSFDNLRQKTASEKKRIADDLRNEFKSGARLMR